jgi:hypothetical protein
MRDETLKMHQGNLIERGKVASCSCEAEVTERGGHVSLEPLSHQQMQGKVIVSQGGT